MSDDSSKNNSQGGNQGNKKGPAAGEGKLHIDSSWKAQVQADRERLDRETRLKDAAEESNRRKREAGILGKIGGAGDAAKPGGAAGDAEPGAGQGGSAAPGGSAVPGGAGQGPGRGAVEGRRGGRPAEAVAEAEGEASEEADRRLPPASFETLVQSLATQAIMFLTPQRDPQSGRNRQNIELAKHTIDLLAVLEEKTKGNLTDHEKSLLNTVLYQARMAYVQAARNF